MITLSCDICGRVQTPHKHNPIFTVYLKTDKLDPLTVAQRGTETTRKKADMCEGCFAKAENFFKPQINRDAPDENLP